MGRRGPKGRNLADIFHVRMNPDTSQVIKAVAENGQCNSSDVIRTCVEAMLITNPIIPLAMKQVQRNLENGGN